MNQQYNINLLKKTGWTCKACSCPGSKRYDCLNANFPGVAIKVRPTGTFKIYKRGLLIASGLPGELQKKLNENEFTKATA